MTTLTNAELAAQLTETVDGWQAFVEEQVAWLTEEVPTVIITHPFLNTPIETKTLWKVIKDYDDILGENPARVLQIEQWIQDFEGYELTLIGYVNTSAASEAAAATSAQAAASSATAAATSETNAATSATAAAASETNVAALATSAALSETNAATSATQAASSADNASISAAAAASSENSASTSAASAANSAATALTQADLASTSATNADASAQAAAASATAAATSETNAAASATAAANSATASADSATDSLASANTANTAATAASASASAAATSETTAAVVALEAETSASNAAASETAAAASATTAATEALNAAASETAAATSATNAAASEAAAAISEANAASSATAAQTAQTAAETAETNAASSATAAETAETNAASSATAAAISETNAAASEAAAASSATAAATSETNAAVSETNAAQAVLDAQAAQSAAEAAEVNADAAVLSAQAAQTAAESAKTGAESAESSALSHASNASISAAASANSASAAQTAQGNAEAAATASATSESNAATSESKAADWAETPYDTEVEPGMYSALHWAIQAQLNSSGIGSTDDLAEGTTNLYWKEAPSDTKQYARQDGQWTELVIPEGYTSADFDTDLATKSTDDLPEGASNVYFTAARAVAAIQGDLSWNAANWDTAYSWGDHSAAGYLTSETNTSLTLAGNTLTYTDETGTATPIDLSAYLDEDSRAIASGILDVATGIVTFTRDDTSTFTLDLSGLLDDTNLVTSVNSKSGVVVLNADDIADGATKVIPTAAQESNWDTAYGWGNHASAGYLTSFTESDPTVPSHVKGITTTNISNWDTAYGWGNHASEGYLTSFTESDPTVPSHVKGITTGNISNWNTAYNWGNHASAGYQSASTAITTSNIGDQSVNYATSAGNADTVDSLHSSSLVQTGYNSSLNSDSRNTRGVTRLYRRDSDSDYSVQTYWTGARWRLYGYLGDSGHADTHVGYADSAGSAGSAGNADTVDGYHASSFHINGYGNDMTCNKAYADDWFRAVGSCGLYFESYGTGLWSVQNGGGQYGSVSTYSSIGGWPGYSIDGMVVFMANPTNNEWGIYNDWNNEWMVRGVLNGSVYLYYDNSIKLQTTSGGCTVSGTMTTTDTVATSDRNLKDNIKSLSPSVCLDIVNALRPVSYDWKEDGRHDNGLIAQEVAEVAPLMVNEEVTAVNYQKIVTYLIGAIQDQQKQIDELKQLLTKDSK